MPSNCYLYHATDEKEYGITHSSTLVRVCSENICIFCIGRIVETAGLLLSNDELVPRL